MYFSFILHVTIFSFLFFPSHFVVWERKEEKKSNMNECAFFFFFFLFPGVFNCDESVKVAVCTKG